MNLSDNVRNIWLDILRSLAIALVLLSHGRALLIEKLPYIDYLRLGGFWGVELFFILSGFLVGRIMYESFYASPKWIFNFLIRRWFRTLPNYFLFLTIKIILLSLGIGVVYESIMPFCTFTQNLAWRHPDFFPEAWSLSVEEVFYFTVPITLITLWKLLHKLKFNFYQVTLIVIAIFSIFSCGLRIYFAESPNLMWDADIRKVVIFRFDSLMFGFMTYFIWAKYKIISPTLSLALGSLLLIVSAFSALQPIGVLNASLFAKTWLFSITSIGFCLILLFGLQSNFKVNNAYLNILFKKTSTYSYSLYLSHLSILEITNKLIGNKYLAYLVWLVLTILFSAIIYEYFEKKWLSYRDKKFPSPCLKGCNQ